MGPAFAVSVTVMWTSVRQDTAILSAGNACVASETQQGDTASCVGLGTMEMLCTPKTVGVRYTYLL